MSFSGMVFCYQIKQMVNYFIQNTYTYMHIVVHLYIKLNITYSNVFITHRMDFRQTSVNRDLFQNITICLHYDTSDVNSVRHRRLLAYQSSHELVQWYIYPIDKPKLANGYLRKTHITVLNINLETNCSREEIVFMNL